MTIDDLKSHVRQAKSKGLEGFKFEWPLPKELSNLRMKMKTPFGLCFISNINEEKWTCHCYLEVRRAEKYIRQFERKMSA